MQTLSELVDYKYSTFSEVVKEVGQKEAEDMVLSSVAISQKDLFKMLRVEKKN